MLPRQGEMGENTPFTRKCTSEPSRTFERVTTSSNNISVGCVLIIVVHIITIKTLIKTLHR